MKQPPKYIDFPTDYGFKHLFGNKVLLMAFLNALFEKEGKKITNVKYLNKEMAPEIKDERLIIYDIYCKVNEGEDFILEMQHKPQDTFRERALYYMSRSVVEQGVKGKNWMYRMKPVYGLFITNFHLKDVEMGDEPLTEVVLENRKTHEVFTEKYRMFFLDLLAFNKKEDELSNDLERWIYSIKVGSTNSHLDIYELD